MDRPLRPSGLVPADVSQATHALPQQEVSWIGAHFDPFTTVINQPLNLLGGVIVSVVLVPSSFGLLMLECLPQFRVQSLRSLQHLGRQLDIDCVDSPLILRLPGRWAGCS